ncbi:unnamed protein product [Cutaneotrichosporon oleaginosum]
MPNLRRYPTLQRYLQQRRARAPTPAPERSRSRSPFTLRPSTPLPWSPDTPRAPVSAEALLGAALRGAGASRLDLSTALAHALSAPLQRKVWSAADHDLAALEATTPDGVSVKPFRLSSISGTRDTPTYEALARARATWPLHALGAQPDIERIDLAVGRAAYPSLHLDGILHVRAAPDILDLEARMDAHAARTLPPSEVRAAARTLADLDLPSYPNGTPVGLARATDPAAARTLAAQWHAAYRTALRDAAAHTLAQLLVAHEACGAVHAAAVVGGTVTRFFVLGGRRVAADMGGDAAPLFARAGVPLAHVGAGETLGAPQPLACAWDMCAPLPEVAFGPGFARLADMLRAAEARLRNGPHTLLQDVVGAVHPHEGEAGQAGAGQAETLAQFLDGSVRVVPVSADEMSQLIDAARWIPRAMYKALENLTAGFGAQAAAEKADAKVDAPDAGGKRVESAGSEDGATVVDDDADLAGFKLGMAGGTEDELFDLEGDFFVSIDGVDVHVDDSAHADVVHASSEATPYTTPEITPKTTSENTPSTSEATASDSPAELTPPATTASPLTPPTPSTEAIEPAAKTHTRLPPHLAALQALYDLEGDVVKTSEVTTKVDVPGTRPPPARPMGFRGSSGAGPRRPGEEEK